MNTSCNSICLVDGSGYIFRAFYALPPMTRPDGTPVNAVYGFINMLMNLIKENNCPHIVVIFDAKRKNFRNDIFAAYKENRKETPPELVPQFGLIRQAVEAFNIPWLEMEGFEADDLIATYARIASQKGWQTRVISADKDLMQLMSDTVSLYDPMKRKEITMADVQNKFGVTPDKVIDVQALMGDSTDNIPGATGIGPKTAAELINQFGSLDSLLQHLSDIKQEKRREGLIRDTAQILMSKKLVELDSHAPVGEDLDVFKAKDPNYEQIESFLIENDFKSLLAKTKTWAEKQKYPTISTEKATEIPTPTTHYETVQEESVLKKWIDKIIHAGFVSIDTETNDLDPHTAKIVGFSLCIKSGEACYVPLRHGDDEGTNTKPIDLFSFGEDSRTDRPKQIPVQTALNLLRPILEDKKILKIGHNIKFDMHILTHAYGENAPQIAPVEDTMLLSYTLNGTRHGHGMDELAGLYLNHTTIKYRDICGTGRKQITFDKVPLETATPYAAEDADITLRLYQLFKPQVDADISRQIYENVDSPLIPILFEMERAGVMVDTKQLHGLNAYFEKELTRLTGEIHALAGEEFNINSPAQLGVILFEKKALTGGKKGPSGSWTTDVKVLEKLAEDGDVLSKTVLEYRSYAKLKNTYVDALLALLSPAHPRVHTSFSLTSTSTGRLASSEPNLQNIPIRTEAGKEIRKAFIAKPGYTLVAADYSQIELRLLAAVADVKLLKEALINGSDIHASTASQVFGIPLDKIDSDTRRRAKAINFGIIYGISPFGLANQLGISRTEAKGYIDAYFDRYPQIKTYMEQTIAFAHEHGYVLTPFGRKCFIYGINERMMRSFAERAAINAPIQGGAADIIKMAMIGVQQEIITQKVEANLLLQVHDELIFEVKDTDVDKAKALIKTAMESVVHLDVPFIADVGVGHNWKEAH